MKKPVPFSHRRKDAYRGPPGSFLIGAGVFVTLAIWLKSHATTAALVGDTGAAWWATLIASPAMQVQGAVVFPDGSAQPVAILPIKQDWNGATYTLYNGRVFRLSGPNQDGSWSATSV